MAIFNIYTWQAFYVAAKLSLGIYFNEGVDISRQTTYEKGWVHTAGSESALVILKDPAAAGDHYCMAAFRGREDLTDWDKITTAAKDIRDSDFSHVVSDEDDYGNNYGDCTFNDELMENFLEFENESGDTVFDSIMDCLENCETDTYNGAPCDLYVTGHSNGGVYALATAVKMRTKIRDYKGDQSYNPTVVTFGVPPSIHKNDSCNLLDEDKIWNFITLNGYTGGISDELVVFDPVPAIGKDTNAAHIGRHIIVSDDWDNVKVYNANEANSAPLGDSEYNYSNTVDDVARMYAHSIDKYKSRIGNLYDNSPGESKFGNGHLCAVDSHCQSGTCFHEEADRVGAWFDYWDVYRCDG